MLRQALEVAARTPVDPSIAVNLSPRQAEQPDLVERILEEVERSDVAPERLCLELTETSLIRARPFLGPALQRLRDSGIRLALDDFGTGYASLGSLRRFPVDILKIDRSFIAGLETSGADRAIVAAVVALAERLGLSTIAEGVETPEQARILTELGCTGLQGFLLARPRSAETLVMEVR